MEPSHLYPRASAVTAAERQALFGHGGCLVWLTGLSGAGKSTVAARVERLLYEEGATALVLDGDNLRAGLNRDLGFTLQDRAENIRRAGEVAALLVDAGLIVIAAFISPSREERSRLRRRFETGRFLEVHVSCRLDICERRDPKGLYKKARAGALPDFTGVASAYEPPLSPELTVDTGIQSPDESAGAVMELLRERGHLQGQGNSRHGG